MKKQIIHHFGSHLYRHMRPRYPLPFYSDPILGPFNTFYELTREMLYYE